MKKIIILTLISGLFSGLFFLMITYTRVMKRLFCLDMTDICIGTFDYLNIFFLLAPAIFVLSLAAYFLNEDRVHFWIKITGIFSIFYLLVIFLVPKDEGGGIMDVLPDARVMTLISVVVLYFVVSAIYFLAVITKDSRNKK